MSRCGRCNRPLRDDASIELGYGPGCWERLGVTARAAALGQHDAMADDPAAPAMPPLTSGVPSATDSLPPGPPADAPRSGSPLAIGLAWAVVLLAAAVVVEHWRWVLAVAALLVLAAVVGLAIESVQQRRWRAGGPACANERETALDDEPIGSGPGTPS